MSWGTTQDGGGVDAEGGWHINGMEGFGRGFGRGFGMGVRSQNVVIGYFRIRERCAVR